MSEHPLTPRQDFEDAMQSLRSHTEWMEPAHRKRYIPSTPFPEGAAEYAIVACAAYTGITGMPGETPRDRYDLSIIIGHSMAGTARPVTRMYSNGESRGDLEDDDFKLAMAGLRRTLQPKQLRWIRNVLAASKQPADDFLPFAVEDLLEQAGGADISVIEVSRYRLYRRFNNGATVDAKWVEGNDVYQHRSLGGLPEAIRSTHIAMPTGDNWQYAAFSDRTERLTVVCDDAGRAATLRNLGCTVVARRDAYPDNAARWEGAQEPTAPTMQQFAALLRATIAAGAQS